MARILVAGAGYLGMAFAQRMAREGGHSIWIARRTAQPDGEFKTIACDFTQAETLRSLPDVDAVYYAVSADDGQDASYERAYYTGVKNLLAEYRSRGTLPKFYYSSSTSVYAAHVGEEVIEDSPLVKDSPSRFMVAGEGLLLESGCEGAILRYGGIYGPGRNAFVRRVRDKLEVLTPGSRQYMNRIHRDDAVGMVAHLLKKQTGLVILNAVDREPSVRDEVIAWTAQKLGLDLASYPRDLEAKKPRSHKRALSRRLQDLGYQYEYPSYREGYPALIRELQGEG